VIVHYLARTTAGQEGRREERKGKKRRKESEEEQRWNRKRRRAKGGGWAEIRSVVEVQVLSVTFYCSESISVETKVT
jgi:hypothetical protein